MRTIKRIFLFFGLLPLIVALYKISFAFDSTADLAHWAFSHGFSFLGALPDDPIKYISDLFALSALFMLSFVLAITPLRKIFSINLLQYRRFFGLFTFFYALLHLLVFFIIDQEASLLLFWDEAVKKPFLLFGVAAFSILAFMAATSFKTLFKRYRRSHKLLYLAVILILFHYALSLKVITLTAGLFITLFCVLLLLRGQEYLFPKKD